MSSESKQNEHDWPTLLYDDHVPLVFSTHIHSFIRRFRRRAKIQTYVSTDGILSILNNLIDYWKVMRMGT